MSESREKGVKREKVKALTRWSRQRMRMLIASLNLELVGLPIFSCLTYPAEYPLESKVFKRHLDSLGKRFLRKYPWAALIWKLEFQKRGAAHFHLIVFGVKDMLEFRDWLVLAWVEVVGAADAANHLKAGTRTEQLRSLQAAISYVAGYVSKEDQTRPGEHFGRYWGVIGRKNLPIGKRQSMAVDPEVAVKLDRTGRRLVKALNRKRRIKVVAKVCRIPWGQAADWMMQQRAREMVEHFGRKIPRKVRFREGVPTRHLFTNANEWMRYVLWEQKQKV